MSKKLEWQTVVDWEKYHEKDFPSWCVVYCYDGYGECWDVVQWVDRIEYIKQYREEDQSKNSAWDFQFEPMVCLPTDKTTPNWGDGIVLELWP